MAGDVPKEAERSTTIDGGVGRDAANAAGDVRAVQELLNGHIDRLIPARPTLAVTGAADAATVRAIVDFQQQIVGCELPDGRVDPAGATLRCLMQPRPSGDRTLTGFLESLKLRHIDLRQVVAGLGRTLHFALDDLGLPVANGRNHEPPRTLWHNIAPTLIVLDEIAERLGTAPRITTTYRSPEYNNAVFVRGKLQRLASLRSRPGGNPDAGMRDVGSGAATMTQHLAFRAVDFAVGGQRLEAHRIAKSLRGERLPLPRPIRLTNPPVQRVGHVGGRTAFFNAGALDVSEDSFVFRGGLGLHAGYIHLDCRGRDDDWSGR